MKYIVEVTATREFTRTYRVEARTAEAALKAYQSNGKTVEWVSDDILDSFECTEHGDSACVYDNDEAKTLLIDVTDFL
jgi:hypothetical protein